MADALLRRLLVIVACAGSAHLTGCTLGSNGSTALLPSARRTFAPVSGTAASNGHLYVVNTLGTLTGDVTVYALGSARRDRTIREGIDIAGALAFDKSGTLFVANYANGGSITEYAPGKASVLRTIAKGVSYPTALAVDPSGTLYVLNSGNGGSITEYASKSTTVLRSIKKGLLGPVAIAFDSGGTLAVANDGANAGGGDSITEYAPEKTVVLRKIPDRTIQSGTRLAFDRSGTLYVSGFDSKSVQFTVTEYAAGRSSPLRTITAGLDQPGQPAFDKSDDLYVPNGVNTNATVTAYAPGSTSVLRTIADGVATPLDIAFDPAGKLYVCNNWTSGTTGTGSISVYPAGGTEPTLRITNGIHNPVAIAIGP
jgi:sugar lactone lactonase YvrE